MFSDTEKFFESLAVLRFFIRGIGRQITAVENWQKCDFGHYDPRTFRQPWRPAEHLTP
jgi:hypothetical protein